MNDDSNSAAVGQPALPKEPTVGSRWRSNDERDKGRLVDVVCVQGRKVGYRNVNTERLAYSHNFTSQFSPLASHESVRAFTIHVCEACLALRGQMCHNPECRFCRRTMAEVGEYLDVLLIRPIVDGQRIVGDEGESQPAEPVGQPALRALLEKIPSIECSPFEELKARLDAIQRLDWDQDDRALMVSVPTLKALYVTLAAVLAVQDTRSQTEEDR